MRANNRINLFELSKSDSLEESKKIIQNNVFNNYGTVNGSLTGDISGDVSQNVFESSKQKKKGFWELVELGVKIAGILVSILTLVFGIIKFCIPGK